MPAQANHEQMRGIGDSGGGLGGRGDGDGSPLRLYEHGPTASTAVARKGTEVRSVASFMVYGSAAAAAAAKATRAGGSV